MESQPPNPGQNLQPNPQPNPQPNLQSNLPLFWEHQLAQIQQTTAFRGQQELPLSRIKRIVKSSGELQTVSSDVPALFSKASELLIMEMTLRAYSSSSDDTLRRTDIAQAINTTDHLRFLSHRVPVVDEVGDGDRTDDVPAADSVNNQPRAVRGRGRPPRARVANRGRGGAAPCQ